MKYIIIVASFFIFTSCTKTVYTYSGNVFSKTIGKSKNDIFKEIGIPDRIISDGNGGEVLVFEDFSFQTNSIYNQASNGKIYNERSYMNNNQIGRIENKTVTVGSSVTNRNKKYCNIFVNSNNLVYDYKTNYGDLFDSKQVNDSGGTILLGVGVLGTGLVGILFIAFLQNAADY